MLKTLSALFTVLSLLILTKFSNCGVIRLQSDTLDIIDCGSTALISNVRISNCTQSPCTLFIGQDYVISFDLIVAKEAGNLHNTVSVMLRGIAFDLVVAPDPCEFFTCPIISELSTTYEAKVHVPDHLLQMQAYLRWLIRDQDQDQHVCFETPVTLLFP